MFNFSNYLSFCKDYTLSPSNFKSLKKFKEFTEGI